MAKPSEYHGPQDAPSHSHANLAPGRPAIFIIAIWFGLVAWLVEAMVSALLGAGLHHVRVWNPGAVWMGAVSFLLLFAVSGLFLQVATKRQPSARTISVGLLATISTTSVLLLIGRLHPAAALLLGAGVGVRLASWSRSSHRFDGIVRVSLGPLLAIAFFSTVAAASFEPLRERILRSRLAAPAAGAPNIVVIVLDTVRSWNLSLHGYDRPTSPELERFAGRGAVFDMAIATAPYTLPSHYSIFSGLYPGAMTGILRNDFEHVIPRSQPMLAEVLADHGYATAAFVANIYYASSDFGLDRGFARYEDHPVSVGQFVLSTAPGRTISNNGRVRRLIGNDDVLNRKPAMRIVDDFLDWQDGVHGRPFFAFLNLYDAHEPYLPPEPFESEFVANPPHTIFFYDTDRVERLVTEDVSPEETRAQRDRYDAAIASMDAALGSLFRELDGRGVLENTIVVVTSDHGEQFMEHGRLGHVRDMYMSLLHVPLVLVAPGRVPDGLRVETAVSIADLPATILELAALPQPALMPGESLTAFWKAGEVRSERPILAEANPGRNNKSVLDGNYHYIRVRGGSPLLYDVGVDRLEQRNLAGLPEMQARVERLDSLLDRLLSGESMRRHALGSRTGRTSETEDRGGS